MSITKDTKLFYHVGSAYVEITGVTSVSTPDYAITDVESTVLVSDAKEFEPGIGDGGKISFTLKHSEDNFTLVTGLRGTSTSWKVTFHDDSGFTANGYLNKVSAKADGPDKLLVLECDVKISGDVTPVTTP